VRGVVTKQQIKAIIITVSAHRMNGGRGNPNLLMLSLAPRLLLLLRFTDVEAGEPDRSMSLSAMLAVRFAPAPAPSSAWTAPPRLGGLRVCVGQRTLGHGCNTYNISQRERATDRTHIHTYHSRPLPPLPLASTASSSTGAQHGPHELRFFCFQTFFG